MAASKRYAETKGDACRRLFCHGYFKAVLIGGKEKVFFCRGEIGVFLRRNRRKLRTEPVFAFFGKFFVKTVIRQVGISEETAYQRDSILPYVHIATFPLKIRSDRLPSR